MSELVPAKEPSMVDEVVASIQRAMNQRTAAKLLGVSVDDMYSDESAWPGFEKGSK